MLSTAAIRKQLGVTQSRWNGWLRAGLPARKDGRKKVYEPAEVAKWLADRGELDAARAVYPGELAETRDDAATALGVDTRTLAGWMKREGFPGKAGRPGKREGWFPIDAIETWRAETMLQADAEEEDSPSRRFNLARAREKELDLEERLGRLVEADAVERFLLRVVNTAKASLEPLADKVVALLPAKTKGSVRTAVRKRVDDEVRGAFDLFAELLRGDEDEANLDDG